MGGGLAIRLLGGSGLVFLALGYFYLIKKAEAPEEAPPIVEAPCTFVGDSRRDHASSNILDFGD